LPEELLNLPVLVDSRRLDLINGNLYSGYRSPLTPIPGTLSINRFNGTFHNLSNAPQRQTPAAPLTGKAHTYLQNRCRLDAQVSMYLLDPLGHHRVWGSFGPGPFSMLNSMTVPTRLVEFKKGDVQRLRFDMQLDRQQATGTMWAEYSGLQLELLAAGTAWLRGTRNKKDLAQTHRVESGECAGHPRPEPAQARRVGDRRNDEHPGAAFFGVRPLAPGHGERLVQQRGGAPKAGPKAQRNQRRSTAAQVS